MNQKEKFDINFYQVLRKIDTVSLYKGDEYDFESYDGLGDTENVWMKNPYKEHTILKLLCDQGAIKLSYSGKTIKTNKFSRLQIVRLKFNDLLKKHSDLSKLSEKKLEQRSGTDTVQTRKLITRGQDGDYYYKGTRIDMANNTIYSDVFDILISDCDIEGNLSYEKIEEKLISRKYQESNNYIKRNRRILNAISESQGFFKFAKVNGHPIKAKTPDGKQLIEKIRGVGLKLNNPVLTG